MKIHPKAIIIINLNNKMKMMIKDTNSKKIGKNLYLLN